MEALCNSWTLPLVLNEDSKQTSSRLQQGIIIGGLQEEGL